MKVLGKQSQSGFCHSWALTNLTNYANYCALVNLLLENENLMRNRGSWSLKYSDPL